MKKTLFIFTVLLITISAAFSQEIKFGAGAALGSKAGVSESGTKMNFGLHARGVYGFSDELAFTGGFSYFLPTTVGDATFNLMAFNVDVMYYLMDDGDMKLYGLGGLNLALSKTNGFSSSGTSFEVGGGAEFGKFFAELKYDANMKQIQAFVGMYF